MKTTIKLFVAIAMILGLTMGSFAQNGNTDADNIEGKAKILQAIDVIGITALDFGMVSPNIDKEINLVNVATGGQSGNGNEKTGVFSVSASVGSDVQIKFTTLPGTLDQGSTEHLLIDTYTAGWYTANPFVLASGTTFIPGTGIAVNGGNFPTNVVGTSNLVYVFIGATVHPTALQASGDYTANITLTATYN